MISHQLGKKIRLLKQKKYRQKYGLFLVEGETIVKEVLISGKNVEYLIGIQEAIDELDKNLLSNVKELVVVNNSELKNLSTQSTPKNFLAVLYINELKIELPNDEWSILADGINDPGNLGTIIRIADWYGIKKMYLGPKCVDWTNPKCISATKGSFLRVALYSDFDYHDFKPNCPIYGTTLDGHKIRSSDNYPKGMIAIGNETHGLSNELLKIATKKISIERYGSAESLNAAIATAIICDRLISIN